MPCLFVVHTAFSPLYIFQVIFLRKVAEVWNISVTLPYSDLAAALRERVDWLLTEYLPHHNPGDNIPK